MLTPLIDMYAGISPVSVGGDHLGGSLSFARPDPVFADGVAALFRGKLGVSFSSRQDAAMADADLTFVLGDAAFQYRGSGATAGDLRYAGGTVVKPPRMRLGGCPKPRFRSSR